MADVELRVVIQGEDQSQAAVRSLQSGLNSVGASAQAAGAKTQAAAQTGIAGLDKMANAARRVEGTLVGLRSAASAATSAGVGLAALGAALTAVAFLPVKAAAEFERSMSAVQAVVQTTSEQFELMERRARDLGATTRFSAQEAAEGMRFLGQAGFTATEVVDAIGPSLNLAAAGALELSVAADIASNVMSGFGLTAGEVARISDVLAQTAASSNTSVQQLGEAMSFVAPVSAAAGISLEETAAAMGVLGNAGIQASRAGTGLRGIIASLEAPTNRAKAALGRLGVEVSRNEDGSINLTKTMSELNEAGLDVASAFDIFRRVAAPAAIAISKNTDEMEKLTKGALEAEGAAERMAKIMEDNLGGALIALKSAISEAFIALAQNLLPVIRKVVEFVTSATRTFARWADQFPTLSAVILGLIGTLGLLLAALAAILIPLGLIGGGIISLVQLLPLLQAQLAASTTSMRIFTIAVNTAKVAFLAFLASIVITKLFELAEQVKGAAEAKAQLINISRRAAAAEREFAVAITEATTAELDNLKALALAGTATDEELTRLRQLIKVRIQHTGAIVAQKTANRESAEEINKAAAQQQVWIDLLHQTSTASKGVADGQGLIKDETIDLKQVTKDLGDQVKLLADEYKTAEAAAKKFGEEAQKFSDEILKRRGDLTATLEELRRKTLDAGDAWTSLRTEAQNYLAAAQAARDAGDLAGAKTNADLAARAFGRLATEVKEGEQVVVTLERGVATASEGIKRAAELAIEVTEEQKVAAEENQRKQLEFMDSIEQRLITYKERIDELPKTIQLSTEDAEQSIDNLIAKFDELVRKTEQGVEISVKTTSQLGGLVARAGGLVAQTGGRLTGYGGGDKIRALLEPGEWVIRKEAVKKYGNAMFAALNSMKLPGLDLSKMRVATPRLPGSGFQAGGAVPGRQEDSRLNTVNLNLSFGGDEVFPLQGEEQVVESLVRRLRREARVTVS